VGFKAEEPATVEFVRVWLSLLQASLEKKAPESAQKNINLEILRALEVPMPPIELRQQFARRLAAIERCKTVQRRAIDGCAGLFTSLENSAFRGEIVSEGCCGITR
jgi:type I restriction enzyme S subunit